MTTQNSQPQDHDPEDDMEPDEPHAPPAAPNLPHKPADDSEEVYYEGSPKLRGHLDRVLGYGFLGISLIAIAIVVRYNEIAWLSAGWMTFLLCVLGIGFILLPALLAKTVRYRISNYRIDYERGLISRTIDTLELWHVDDVHFYQSLFDRILRVGSITIMSTDKTNPRLELHGLPQPRELFNTLKQRVIAVKRQRGVIKMDI